MTPRQKQEFINGLTRNRIPFKVHHGGEISMLCPRCGPLHDRPRQTLSINSNNDKWQCWRCPELRGRRVTRLAEQSERVTDLLEVLNLAHLKPIFNSDDVSIEDDSLEKMKRRLTYGDSEPTKSESVPLELPEGYRRDWDQTIVGRTLYRYLTQERKLDEEAILKYKLGYITVGKYTGCVVLPVYMNRVLRFWQVRRVMLTGGNSPKYDSPKVERKDVLFDYDSVEPENVIIVEGIFDKLALGGSCVGLLGKKITEEQIALLAAKSVKTATVILDGEAWSECQQVAHEVKKKLWGIESVKALRLPFGKDPGKLGRRALENPVEILRLRP